MRLRIKRDTLWAIGACALLFGLGLLASQLETVDLDGLFALAHN